MKEINFEGVGLKFNISRIAFSLFGIQIYWYAICIVLGFGVGIIIARRDDRKIWLEI